MKRFKLASLPLVFLVFLWVSACKHDPAEMPNPGGGEEPEICDTVNVTFQGSVFPILQQYCLSCHSGATPEAGLNFENYEDVAFVARSGQLLGAIRHEAGFTAMPPSGIKLSDCNIAKFEIWIRDTTFTEPDPGGNTCDPDTVYFQNTILPLLQSSCGIIGCHDPGTATGRIILTDYNYIMNSGVITPGDPQDSELYEKITEDDPDKVMPPPPNASLTAEQKAAVFKWIQQGALNNYCDQAECDTVNVTFSTTIWPVVQGRCFGCHNGPNAQGGISLDNYTNIAEVANSGRLMGAIRHEEGYAPMPQNGSKLSDCNITQFQKWINDGTPNN
ncbi:MAG: hypothetical protein K9H16_01840 [Bacteroidales bacterium]|nr:hypothetical protein [Bacteroidales bacterium]